MTQETLEEAVKVEEPTPEELEELEAAIGPTKAADRYIRSGQPKSLDEVQSPTTVPPWAIDPPPGLKFPPAGSSVAFIRILAKYCLDPAKGDRQCIVWALTEHDEYQALTRARGSDQRAQWELAKGCIRAIDGHIVDWSGENKPGSVTHFWNDLGPKGKKFILNYYVRTHNVDQEEALDFFLHHFAAVTVLPA